MIEIRHTLEEAIRKEYGVKITGSGGMVCPPFTMDFEFEINGKKYDVYLKPRACSLCLKTNNNECNKKPDCLMGIDWAGYSECMKSAEGSPPERSR